MLHGDHLHELGLGQNGHLERICQPDWESIFHNDGEGIEENTVTWADMSAAVSLLLGFCCGRSDKGDDKLAIVRSGMRVNAVLYWLDSNASRYNSLEEIADAAGVTKAAVSKSLMDLRKELGGILPMKLSGSSDNYRKAQQFAVAAQEHSSFSRKDSKKRKASERISLDAVAD
jgi:hypothetical protein